MSKEIKEGEKPKWTWIKSRLDGKYFWAPANYEAETIHLMRVYGDTNTGRQFSKPTNAKDLKQ